MNKRFKNNYFLLLLVLLALNSSQSYAVGPEDADTTGTMTINYQASPSDDQSILQLDISFELSDATSVYASHANLQAENEESLINVSINNIDASVTEVGLEHWFSGQTLGFGVSYASWNDDNQLKNNDLRLGLQYQSSNWLFGLDTIQRDLELAVAVFIPSQGIIEIQRENDGTGFGLSVLYGGWDNFLLGFEHEQFDYDGEIVDSPRFEQAQRLLFTSNNPLVEKTTSFNLAYYNKSGKLLGFGISFDTSLLAQTDSTQYSINYQTPLSENLSIDLGYLFVDQELGNSNVISIGFSWAF